VERGPRPMLTTMSHAGSERPEVSASRGHSSPVQPDNMPFRLLPSRAAAVSPRCQICTSTGLYLGGMSVLARGPSRSLNFIAILTRPTAKKNSTAPIST
jgi:hypothetical protein